MPQPRVYTIPPGVAFLETLADALLSGQLIPGFPDGHGPAALAGATIYLPTQRAARALTAHLAERVGGRALLLPRIIPLGEADEAEFELAAGALGAGGTDVLPPPIAPLERRLVLTRLIQAWSRQVDAALARLEPGTPFLVPSSPADAVGLAADLEALMDDFTVENVPWADLAQAVEVEFSKYFEITLEFVRIAADGWPQILVERGASDPAKRRGALIAAEAERLTRNPPAGPVIAAGSTGSIPSTALLLAAIANLPNGAVVLPGLDGDLDDESWRLIGGSADGRMEPVNAHPQAVLWSLVEKRLALPRAAITRLGEPPPGLAARAAVLSHALRPAETTDLWASIPEAERHELSARGCEGLTLVEAADEREEALAIAIALRETLEEPGKTAALVTPDRGLALRVSAELARWGLTVEDSAGVPLGDSEAGRLARLAAEAASLDFEPLRVLALLAHPAVRLGLTAEAVERATSALEIGVLRGPKPAPGLDGLARALEARRAETGRVPRPRRRLTAEDWDAAADLVERLALAFASFSPEHQGEDERDLVDLARVHRGVVDALAAGPDGEDEPAITDGSFEAVATLFDDLDLAGQSGIMGRFVDYPAFFAALARQRTVTPPLRATHRRIKILGPLEARLLSADRIVLGGLDEGVWPPRVTTDAFLNRPMRSRIGLTPPERRIGQTAHDFVQALGAPEVVITRAAKRDGSPMVPSRFLQRLQAFIGEGCWTRMTRDGERYRLLARFADHAPPAPPLARPAPKPDPALFPRALSVTEIETLVRDPYAIYARHVLGLDALDPIAAEPGAAERGTLIHDVLGRFAKIYPEGLPDRAVARQTLEQLGLDALQDIAEAFPELYAEWRPRFDRMADAFLDWEYERRALVRRVHAEISGTVTIPLGNEVFTLRCRADRIEEHRDGRFTVVDFKTGQPPGNREVVVGFSPQLTLEAAMLMRGGFRDVGRAREAPDLLYVHASGGREPLKPRPITQEKDGPPIADVIEEHYRRLSGLVARFIKGEAAYVSRPYPKYAKRYSDYDHLARVKEWSAAAGADDGGEA